MRTLYECKQEDRQFPHWQTRFKNEVDFILNGLP